MTCTLSILFPSPCFVGGGAAASRASPDWWTAPSDRGGLSCTSQSNWGPRCWPGERLPDRWEQQFTPHLSHLWRPRQRTQGLQQPVLWIWWDLLHWCFLKVIESKKSFTCICNCFFLLHYVCLCVSGTNSELSNASESEDVIERDQRPRGLGGEERGSRRGGRGRGSNSGRGRGGPGSKPSNSISSGNLGSWSYVVWQCFIVLVSSHCSSVMAWHGYGLRIF